MLWRTSSGKSDPQSTIQPTDFDLGGGENTRAPKAAYEPAPPTMPLTGGRSSPKSISSDYYSDIALQELRIGKPMINIANVQKSIPSSKDFILFSAR
jgi:hypothetical protein